MDITERGIIDKFDRAYFGLRSRLSRKRPGSEEIARDDYIRFLEDLDDYEKSLRDDLPETDELQESQEDYKPVEAFEIDESLITRLTEKIMASMRAKKEDMDGGIGIDDIGMPLPKLVGDGPISAPKLDDPAIPKSISQENKAKVEAAANVLIEMGFNDLANQMHIAIQDLEVI
jgi:hypothetical protein